ncbi:rhomboid-like protein [Streptomyces avermitilis]|uniref:rhomboid-like protein n=1 Tax=Streptomyces avermitilis TaxID=33903 RepID=UPI00369E317D
MRVVSVIDSDAMRHEVWGATEGAPHVDRTVDRTVATADAALMDPESGAPPLDGLPRQRTTSLAPSSSVGAPPVPPSVARSVPRRLPRPWLLLPSPLGTPFTLAYALVLVATSLVAEYADPSFVHVLHQASSTDVAHLMRDPLLVLVASALWVAGGVTSPYALGFLLVLTALERRTGGRRTAGIFLLGHVLATLATEVPVGFAVLVGHLPGSSLHRLDYGISFGVAACVGALAGLLTPWPRCTVLVVFGGSLVADLVEFADPLTDWGHLMALSTGIGMWPVVRRWQRARTSSRPAAAVTASGC